MPDLDDIAAYDYELPAARIAERPAAARTGSRLLALVDGALEDARFPAIEQLLQPGDLLVVNDAKVTPVRLRGRRATGGRVELFVLGFGAEGDWADPSRPWITMTRSNRGVDEGESVDVDGRAFLRGAVRADGTTAWHAPEGAGVEWLEQAGAMPLPPYILKRRRDAGQDEDQAEDRDRYQTVYARSPGAVAAPTAGLHFDAALLRRLEARGVERAHVSLLVGAGTFKPVSAGRLSDHELHEEHYVVPEATVGAIAACRARGGRVVAVGTTVVRTLEAAALANGEVVAGPGRTRLFVRPGFRFRVVDALVTNFHLPRSTLLALVCAFGGYAPVMEAYRHAVDAGYRFYSYGDAMFLTRSKGDA